MNKGKTGRNRQGRTGRLRFVIKKVSQAIEKFETIKNSGQKAAWIIFSIILLAFLAYGLSVFLAQPKIETITTNPANTSIQNNSYMNQTQDVNYRSQHTKRHSK